MNHYTAYIIEVRMDEDGLPRAMLSCPPEAVPTPGRYVLAHAPTDTDLALATPIFAVGYAQHGRGFTAAPPFPATWQPGSVIQLTAPRGHGFEIPADVRRLGLVGLGQHVATLLPLALAAFDHGGEVALFTDAPLPRLPSSLEANPLAALADAIAWADVIAIAGPLLALAALPTELRARLPGNTQLLIETALPCGGLAECGICALPAGRGKWLAACTAGPVVALNQLELA